MKRLAALLLGLAIACGAFSTWGLFTAAGSRRFDEMAGMIPFFAGMAGGVLALAAAPIWLVARRRE